MAALEKALPNQENEWIFATQQTGLPVRETENPALSLKERSLFQMMLIWNKERSVVGVTSLL